MEQKPFGPSVPPSFRQIYPPWGRALNIAKILAELKSERRKLDAAIRALQGLALTTSPGVGSFRPRPYPRKNKASKVRSGDSAAGVQPMGKLLVFAARRNRVASRTAGKEKLSGEGTGA
jgi:hypothetical protein